MRSGRGRVLIDLPGVLSCHLAQRLLMGSLLGSRGLLIVLQPGLHLVAAVLPLPCLLLQADFGLCKLSCTAALQRSQLGEVQLCLCFELPGIYLFCLQVIL